ncbi:hypothetical protein RhiirA4_462243 [Rhizophagus irregularis]|uniref:F-box domain-containing protein n=1 Tax=Rhizophagus irregularis TaxID=588596 RepID=A0A2I1GKI2_9GLOM|nr:hypothetical protein RhiirA4_462243 [Rhizophagus irregularis]
MVRLNKDILYLIFEYLEDNLYSCLLVNKTWCEIIVLFLWKDPWNGLGYFHSLILLNVIILHIQDEAKIKEIYNYLENSGIYLVSLQRPLLNYISFCKHLSLGSIMNITKNIDDLPERLIVEDEIFKLFINKNVKITHLYIPKKFNYQIHLIPEAKICLSKIKFLSCYTSINNNILTGLLSEFNVYFRRYTYWESQDEPPFCEILENSLIKHSNTIQYFTGFKPFTTEILSSLVNLKKLELHGDYLFEESKWKCLENLSLPSLQFLILQEFPVKYLISLIENTKGSLTIIELHNYGKFYSENENERIIHTIYQNCPKLIYLTFTFQDDNILEIEKLLTTCQYLNGLRIISKNDFNWNKFFNITGKERNHIFLKLQGEITIEMKYLLKEYEVKGRIVNYNECIRSYQLEIFVIDYNIEL